MSAKDTYIAKFDDQGGRISYSGEWYHMTDQQVVLDGTLSAAYTTNSTAMFEFNGDSIIEVGVVGAVIPPDGASVLPISSYSINGTSPSIYVTPDNYTQATTGIVFFASQPLSNGPHALVISLTQASDTYPFLMDYVIARVINGTIPFPSTSNPASPTSPVASESATSGATAAPASSAVSSKSSSTPTDAIVGGVVGGVVALVAAALLLFFLRHRRKRRTHFDYPDLLDSGLDPVYVVTPYTASPDLSNSPALDEALWALPL
ncbi:hypothetical protein AcW1_007172 [Taiwanofungus camphoratus]|nr:hypothetical protein AcW2_007760 [Antrodia cinnamomea]KAI0952778.1 hypothetical protein AcW1_007172 [Antrodia cinnamomea]